MSGAPGLARPAARSAAVRPRSASLPSPRPASAARSCAAPLFLRPFPPARGDQLIWLASGDPALRTGSVVTVTPLVTALGTPKPLRLLDISPPLPRSHAPQARVIRLRARACAILSLLLVTWEREINSYVVQGVEPFPRPFPASARVGTWEQASASAPRSDRLPAETNKVGAGYGDLQRAGAGARQKFRGSIARLGSSAAAGEVDQAELAQLLGLVRGADPVNGGKLPFLLGLVGHVGRAMLEGLRQAAENAGDLALRRKLGRLRGGRPGRASAGALEQLALAAAGGDRPGEAPGAPNRARASAAMLALHAGRIWIEDVAQAAVSSGHYSNRWVGVRKNAQTSDRRRGPGGAALRIAAESRCECARRTGGERAGVKFPPAVAQPHEAGERSKLRRGFAAVNGSIANV